MERDPPTIRRPRELLRRRIREHAVHRALDEANVTFHAVDPRGQEGLGDATELDTPAGRTEQAANLFRQSSLTVLPDCTGGRVVLNTNKPADKIGEIFDESRS